MTITEFRRVEEALRYIIALEFGQENNALVDDCLADLRQYLKDHYVRIEGVDPLNVEISYGSVISPQPKLRKKTIIEIEAEVRAGREGAQEPLRRVDPLAGIIPPKLR